jgi:mono/diheme cytochrome c family protein
MIHHVTAVILLLSLLPAASIAAESSFEKDLQPYLQTHCFHCHGAEKQEGEFRIDSLSPEVGVQDTPQWAEIIERINSGEMPPAEVKTRPSAEENAKIVQWLADRIKEGEAARMARRDRVSYHRLTREEYVNSVRDLIGVEYDAADPGGLLEDPEWNGFERLGSVLTLSPTHIEKYMTAAEVVLAEAYPDEKVEYLELSRRAVEMQPGQPHYERLEKAGLLDKVRYPITTSGELFRASSPFHGPGRNFPGPGVYEISYTVCGLKPEDQKPPRMQVYEHKLDRVLFEQDIIAPEDKPMTVTFRTHLVRHPEIHVINIAGGPRHPRNNAESRIPFITTAYPRAPWQMKITDEQGLPRVPVLIIDSISMRGPIVTEEEQRRRNEYMATEQGNMDLVRAGLEAMAKRAFRRPLKEGELDTYLNIVEGEIAAGENFVDAIKSAMTAILCSKSFLFLAEGDQNADRQTLSDWELASRLSYFIWSTMPDDELIRAAEQGQLHDKHELQRQLARMLADPRSDRFIKSFPTQWLRLRKVGMFAPDRNIYPNYDSHLEQSMIEEPLAFFGEVLRKELTLREFIDSDWTMVNPRLAGFYGLPDFAVDQFQRVSLRPEHQRGGLLTQAAILSLTSDGTRHRPVHRGVWLSESIFGKTPPPPPANVDPIEPNPIDAPKATIRMKLQAHVHDPRCAACHRNIDPLGMAFDNYNAIGQWRTHEKVQGTGDDPPVDASGALPDGREFANAKEFKQLLMADLDAFNATFIEKLATYGMRRTMTFEDRNELKEIARVSREKDYRVADILEAFVLSDLFQKR